MHNLALTSAIYIYIPSGIWFGYFFKYVEKTDNTVIYILTVDHLDCAVIMIRNK